MIQFTPTERTIVRRRPNRASYDRATIAAILDEGLFCHVGFVADGQPYVIPTIHARIGDRLYVHGSAASHMLRTVRGGIPVCVTVTLLDGLVLARSAFHHSMNYRSVMILGTAVEVTERTERLAALKAIVEHVAPQRWADVRWPSEQELKATIILQLPIEEVSAKIRTGPPLDDEEDYELPCWAGEIPLQLVAQMPIPDPRLEPAIVPPAYVQDYGRPRASTHTA
jgi:nitroimidazol reductase NimA-like FMN-containing flavoprotein (pyridoxamine 5'-phosphate oxidase superfamily)